MFPRMLGYFVWVQGSMQLPPVCFRPLACLTAIYIFPDICLNVRPPVVPRYQLLGYVPSWMSCCDAIMVLLYDILLQLLVLWDINPVMPGNNPVILFCPILLLP